MTNSINPFLYLELSSEFCKNKERGILLNEVYQTQKKFSNYSKGLNSVTSQISNFEF